MDPIMQFKEMQKASWAGFSILENLTGTTAPSLVKFARVTKDAAALDVACGTGVVALTAARLGAKVTGIDLTPQLVRRARENSELMNLAVDWHEGDVEALPFPNAAFDFVLSQFGHIFAPRPDLAVREMLRVLKPGGTIAFSTWPPELLIGRAFATMAKYGPPPVPCVAPPPQWGDSNVVRERLGTAVRDLAFTRGTMKFQILSPQHYRVFIEQHFTPATRLVELLSSDPAKLAAFRREMEELATTYFTDNVIRQDYLITRAMRI